MSEPVWLDLADAVAIHDMMLSQHGGLAGIRDEGMLRSALDKPKNQFSYGQPSLADMAASYAAGIILNHPFLDGNKRTGFLVAVTFLELNGKTFTASEESAVAETLGLASGKTKELRYSKWLEANCRDT